MDGSSELLQIEILAPRTRATMLCSTHSKAIFGMHIILSQLFEYVIDENRFAMMVVLMS
jgi:hypothetical protein